MQTDMRPPATRTMLGVVETEQMNPTTQSLRIWLVTAVAFFAGVYLGFAHGRRGTLRMGERWYADAATERRALIAAGQKPTENRPYQLIFRCASDATELAHRW